MTDEGLLISRERIGYFVNTEMVFQQAGTQPAFAEQEGAPGVDWFARLQRRPSEQVHLTKPRNWRRYPFPFIYRSEEHTSELQSLMRNSYAVFCLKKKKKDTTNYNNIK